MKRLCLLFVSFIICCILTSCEQGVFVMREVNSSVILYDHQTAVVHDSEMVETLHESNIKLEDFFEQLNVSLYKQEEQYRYTVIKTNDGGYVVYYDENVIFAKDATLQKITFSQDQNKDALMNISPGAGLSEVCSVDPDGYYEYLRYYSSESIPLSYHFFRDGTGICILYKDSTVVEINCFII